MSSLRFSRIGCPARSVWLALTLVLLPISAFSQVQGLSGWSIYLDPGHSRTENMGVFGYSEAEKNLRVGLALRELLLSRTDIDTVYISRTNDSQEVSLSQRSDHANTLGAAWFHSIHSNAGSSTANNTLLLWGQYLNGNEKRPVGGQAMSDLMSPLLSRGMRIDDRGSIGDCSFYRSFISNACSGGGPYLSVNRRTTMPSELSEAGFHTNPTQNQRNMNEEWKRLEAWTFFWSILDHHGMDRPSVSNVTGIVSDLETGTPINGAEITLAGEVYSTDTYETLFSRYSSDPTQLRNGVFFFEDVDASLGKGSLTMNVNAEGYESYVAEINPVDTFFTFVDVQLVSSIPPRVTSTEPDSGETVRIIDPVAVNFSRPMNRALTEAAISFMPEVTGSFAWTSDFHVRFSPDSLLPQTDYTLTIGEGAMGKLGDLIDGDGDGISGGEFVLPFKTGFPDYLAPQVVDSEPRQRSVDVDVEPVLSLTFDERIDSSSISANMLSLAPTAGGPEIRGWFEHYVVGGLSVPTFFPESELDTDTQYRFTLEAGATDVFGNEIKTAKNLFFTTGATHHARTSVDSFDGDLSEWWVPQQSGSTTGILTELTARTSDSTIVNRLTGSVSSMQLDYGWDTAASDWLIRLYLSSGDPKAVLFDSTYWVEAYVFGDGGGSRFRFALDDHVPNVSAANHEVSPWITVDWYGWRLVTWRPSEDGTGSWLGDGSLDGTLRFDSIQMTYAQGAVEAGTIYIDDLRVAKATPSVASETESIPSRSTLDQNYPNPFERTTRLVFRLETPTRVRLTVYSVTGAEVARLVDDVAFSAGSHKIDWDAGALNLPSGVYFARLEADGISSVATMLLMR